MYGPYFNLLALISKKKAAEKAFEVFVTVRKGKVLPKQEAYLETAKKTILDVCGHRLQTYSWSGNKETVLLVHGWRAIVFVGATSSPNYKMQIIVSLLSMRRVTEILREKTYT